MRTMDPGTKPPPRTRSNSPLPLESRLTSDISTSSRTCTFEEGANPAKRSTPPEVFAATSMRVFHSPHSAHWPAHLALSAPHSRQLYRLRFFVLPLAISIYLYSRDPGRYAAQQFIRDRICPTGYNLHPELWAPQLGDVALLNLATPRQIQRHHIH